MTQNFGDRRFKRTQSYKSESLIISQDMSQSIKTMTLNFIEARRYRRARQGDLDRSGRIITLGDGRSPRLDHPGGVEKAVFDAGRLADLCDGRRGRGRGWVFCRSMKIKMADCNFIGYFCPSCLENGTGLSLFLARALRFFPD
jgi:hypothetical protein